jgi:glycosyltransferase involved in cell wall biosynthesis
MRIAIYHNTLWAKYKGGVFGRLYSLAQAAGDQVRVVHIAETEGQRIGLGKVDLSYHQYPYHLLFTGSYDGQSSLRKSWSLARDIVRNPADVTILPCYDLPEYWVMLFTCMLLGRKRAVFSDSTLRDRSRTGLKEAAKRFFFARCHGFFTYGARSKEYLLYYGVPDHKIHFRCQAAALPHDYSAAAVIERYQNRPPEGPLRFLYVGRLSPEKGLEDLLAAFREILQRHPGARLELAGNGPLKDSLIQRTAALGLNDSVTFLGSRNIEELAELYMASDVLVLPSLSEPWGLVANEALSYGCPVIVSDACGCAPAVVKENITGFTFRAGDVAGLGKVMSAAADMRARRLEVARDCIELIANFTPQHAAEQILEGCQRILAHS